VPLRIAYFGTPEAAATILSEVSESDHQVCAVVTSPDRPAGRGLATKSSPVKELSLAKGYPVLQPQSLKSESVESELRALGADVFVVVAYGLILPGRVLEMPRLGSINVHFSLLPRLRGAAPVQWAIINGDLVTGVTIMQMDEGLDTGPIFVQAQQEIDAKDTTGSLLSTLTKVGAKTLINALGRLERDELEPSPQNEEHATYAPKISSNDARIDWALSAEQIERRVRALNPHPGAWTEVGGKRLKIWASEITEGHQSKTVAGTITHAGGQLMVETGSGSLRLLEVQPEGSSRMTAAEFLRGRPRLGD
jgi:methionyl-tRNA formyltransferase